MNLLKILCWIGIHKWKYTSSRHDAPHICDRCGIHQEASYDMATGETVYYNAPFCNIMECGWNRNGICGDNTKMRCE